MAYVAPTWVNGGPPALDAAALNAISQALAKLPMENGGTFATSGAAGLYNLINAAATLTSGTLASGDYVGIKDVSAGTGKQVTLSNLAAWITSNSSGTQIVTGSYTGTGTYGISNKNTVNTGKMPKVFLVVNTASGHTGNCGFCWVNGSNVGGVTDGYLKFVVLSWEPTGISWYGTYDPPVQMNISGDKYIWVAWV